MKPYRDLSGTSGITGYESGNDYLDLEFEGGTIYRYDCTKPGQKHVDKMKLLAAAGKGLATYVNQHVRKNFAAQLK